MKLKPLFFILACFGASCMNLAQDTQPLSDERGIRDLLWKKLEPLDYSPDTPIDVLFFDINHDGITDALVSYRENQWGGGLHGNDWNLWRYKDGEWQEISYKKLDEYTIDPSSCVYARGDDFYSLTKDGQPQKLILAYSWAGNEFGDDFSKHIEVQNACEITIDDEGYLKTIPFPELTWRVVDTYDGNGDIVIAEKIDPKALELQKQLVPLDIEWRFPPKPEDDKSPSVATAEQEGGAQASPPSREGEELEIRKEESGIEKEKANRLWLYAALALLLSAVFYFVRRKKP